MLKLSELKELEEEFCVDFKDFKFHSHHKGNTFGSTNCYRYTQDGKLYCVKTVPSFFIDRTMTRAKVIREIYNLSRLRFCPLAVVQGIIFPSQEHGHNYSFVTPHMEGESLEDFMVANREHPVWDDTMKMLTAFGIAAGMQCLHYFGFVHGYLSPQNVVFDERFEPLVVDYWYSKFIASEYYQAVVTEKECWCAPERFSPKGLTQKADVFSFGMILYQIATRSRPIARATKRELILKRTQHGDRPRIPEGVMSKQLEDLIKRCWDPNPDNRPSFDAILAEFYDEDHPLFPNVDTTKFLEFRSKVLFPFMQGVSDIAYFAIGDLPGDAFEKYNALKAAADNGNTKAMFRLWTLTERDELIPYLKKASDLGDKSCQFAYSEIVKDQEERMKYLKMSAEQGYVKAMRQYGIETNDLDMLKRAALLGSERAEMECYWRTNEVRYLMMAANYHDPDANYQLAVLHETGETARLKGDYADLVQPGITKTHEEYMAEAEARIPNKIFKDLGLAFELYLQGLEWGHVASIKKMDTIQKNGQKLAAHIPSIFKQKKEPTKIDTVLMYAMYLVYGSYPRIRRNPIEGIKIFKAAVQSCNSADAAYQLYVIYERGDSEFQIEVNEEMALQYLKVAALQGHPSATVEYAKVLAKRASGVQSKDPDQDMKEIFRFSRHAALLGDSDALERHALLLQQICDTKAADIEAAVFYRLAADRGNIESQYTFAQLAEDGTGLDQSLDLAIQYYRMGAKKGIPEYMIALADIYDKHKELNKSDREVMKMYLKAGAFGSSKGMLTTGTRYEEGIGCEKNLKKAMRYYRAGAILGNTDAQFKYANMLMKDSEGGPNVSEAVHFYSLAVRAGNVEAKKAMARMLLNGQLSKDTKRAMTLYKEAADADDSEAQYQYAMLVLNSQPKQTEITDALKYLAKAADRNHVDAILKLAEIYEQGEYVNENLGFSCSLYRKAGNITGDVKYFTHVASHMNSVSKMDDMGDSLDFADINVDVMKDSFWEEDDPALAAQLLSQSLGQFKPKPPLIVPSAIRVQVSDEIDIITEQLQAASRDGDTKAVNDGIATLVSLSQGGNTSARRELGKIYLQGVIVPQDLALAEEHLSVAAQRGDRDALFELGNLDMLLNKTELALVNYQMAHNRGHTYAKTRCSVLLFEGPEGLLPLIRNPHAKISPPLDENHLLGLRCSVQDLDGLYCFSLSTFYGEKAIQGNKYAQHNYGMLVESGMTPVITEVNGLVWIKKAADQGLAFSEYQYGSLCLMTPGMLKEGLQYLEKGVEKNYVRSIIELATAYENGRGVELNLKKALEIANKGVALKHPVCQCIAARIIMRTTKTKEGLTRAMILLNASKSAGNADAAVMMGTILNKSHGPEDQQRAVECFRFAANKSLPLGHYYYGMCLKNGQGCEKNVVEGRKHLKLASSLGVKEAMIELADMAQKEQKAPNRFESFRRLIETASGTSDQQALELLEHWKDMWNLDLKK